MCVCVFFIVSRDEGIQLSLYVIVIVIRLSPFIPFRNLDEVFTYLFIHTYIISLLNIILKHISMVRIKLASVSYSIVYCLRI